MFACDDPESRQATARTVEDLILELLPDVLRYRLLFDWAFDGGSHDELDRRSNMTETLAPVKQRSALHRSETVWMLVIDIEPYMAGYIVGNSGRTINDISERFGVEVEVVGKKKTKFPFVYVEGKDESNVKHAGLRIQDLARAASIRTNRSGSAEATRTHDALGDSCSYYGPAEVAREGGREIRLDLPRWIGDTKSVEQLLENARFQRQYSCWFEIERGRSAYPLRVILLEPDAQYATELIANLLLSTMPKKERLLLGSRLFYEFAVQQARRQGDKDPLVVPQRRSLDATNEFGFGAVIELDPDDPKEVGAILGPKGSFHKRLQQSTGTSIGIVDRDCLPQSPFVFIFGSVASSVEIARMRIQDMLICRRNGQDEDSRYAN
jgi:hypothetical protein